MSQTFKPYKDLEDNQVPDFDSLTESISSQLFEINGNVSSLSNFIKALQNKSTLQQASRLNDRCVAIIDNLRQMFKIINTRSQQLQDMETKGTGQRLTKEKLGRDVSLVLGEFQQLQQKFIDTTKKLNEAESQTILETPTEDDQVLPQQQFVVQREALNNEELAYHTNLVQEREAEIEAIQRGIGELNEIFHDLGSIVNQQGSIVDNIESNLYSVADNTRSASYELNRALRYQRRTGARCFYLLMILLFVLLVVGIATWI